MTEKIIVDGVDVSECEYYCDTLCVGLTDCNGQDCVFKQLKRLETENKKLKKKIEKIKKENEEINDRMAKVIYRATGGRLSYSTYTLEAIEQAFYDQLDVLSEQKIEEAVDPYKQALEKVRELGRKTGSIRLIEIADEVLK